MKKNESAEYKTPRCRIVTVPCNTIICTSLGQEGETGMPGGNGTLQGGFNDEEAL